PVAQDIVRDHPRVGRLSARPMFTVALAIVLGLAQEPVLSRAPVENANLLTGPCDVVVLPDLDGDGLADLALSVPGASVAAERAGAFHLFSSRGGEPLRSFRGERFSLFGYSLCAVADQVGDGLADLLVGAPSSTSDSHVGALEPVFPSTEQVG